MVTVGNTREILSKPINNCQKEPENCLSTCDMYSYRTIYTYKAI